MAQTVPPTAPVKEYQLKAVFLFNFTQFVDWLPAAFADPQSPLLMGVLGDDPFRGYLEDAVRGERVKNRPIVVQRYRKLADITPCHILFISRSETDRIGQILDELHGRNILTVSDADDFATRGGMIQFVTDKNKIRLRINVDAAKAANVTISSKLLRAAEIVTSGKE
jgi:hypothetical protein